MRAFGTAARAALPRSNSCCNLVSAIMAVSRDSIRNRVNDVRTAKISRFTEYAMGHHKRIMQCEFKLFNFDASNSLQAGKNSSRMVNGMMPVAHGRSDVNCEGWNRNELGERR